MSSKHLDKHPYTDQKKRRGPIRDGVHPHDFQALDFTYCCEQCSHFCPESKTCTIGMYAEPHRQQQQLATYHLSGKMVFCRFLEID
jgi:hypothetical protein